MDRVKEYLAFDKSRIHALSAQERVALCLSLHGAFVNRKDNRERNDIDVIYNNRSFRIEIKGEDNKKETGNICVEITQGKYNKPSGISTTEATLCIHTFGETCVIYRTLKMKEWLRQAIKNKQVTVEYWGDNNNGCCIFPIEWVAIYDWCESCLFEQMPYSSLWIY